MRCSFLDHQDATNVRRPLKLALLFLCLWVVFPPAASATAGAEVLLADREMAAAVANRDARGLRAMLLPDVLFLGTGALLRGPEAAVEAWQPFLEPQGATLSWQPEEAMVARSGDLAFTFGPYQIHDGAERPVAEGRYLTVWRKVAQGWRVAVDGTATSLEPQGLELRLEMDQKPPRAILQGPATMAARAVKVVRSRAGDLAYAVGDYAAPGDTGSRRALRGVFLGLWRKGDDGSWSLVGASFPTPR
jgi:ketosteroid isomerase-like protein